MMIETTAGVPMDSELLVNYFRSLVNRFFKILPIREQGDESLVVYLESFQKELLGCQSLIVAIKNDALYISLLATLQYLIDNPDCSVKAVRRQVFNAISICNKLKSVYAEQLANAE